MCVYYICILYVVYVLFGMVLRKCEHIFIFMTKILKIKIE